jgi:hypothetical protein
MTPPRVLPFDSERKKNTGSTKPNVGGTWRNWFRHAKAQFSILLLHIMDSTRIVFLLQTLQQSRKQKQTQDPVDLCMLEEEICSYLERISIKKIRVMPVADEYSIKIIVGSFYSQLLVDGALQELIDSNNLMMGKVLLMMEDQTEKKSALITSTTSSSTRNFVLKFFFKTMLFIQSFQLISMWRLLDSTAIFSEHFILFFLQILERINSS